MTKTSFLPTGPLVRAALSCAIALAAAQSHAQAARYELDPEHISQLDRVGRSLPLTLQATWNKSSARGSFKRSNYGMKYAVENGWVGDEVPLIIEFEAIRK